MSNILKNSFAIYQYFGTLFPPARRIGQLLGSNPSAEAGDVGMGPYSVLYGPFLLVLIYAYVGNALNPGGLGAGPHLNQSVFLYLFKNVLQLAYGNPALGVNDCYCRTKNMPLEIGRHLSPSDRL